MIVSVINDGFHSLPVPRHKDFLHALHHSLTVNPKSYDPQSFDRFGFEQRELYRLKVVLLRPLAYAFLKTLDSDLTDKTLDKLTSFKAYDNTSTASPG
ncbi:MAG: hypothetical protein SF123_25590 [Chloroflexota bacterium]|nr:hypothetical protein [Chloroflexota bacterium]